MKRFYGFLFVLIALVGSSHAAVVNVTEGENKLWPTNAPGLDKRNDGTTDTASGDTLILAAGTYTFSAINNAMMFDHGGLGHGAAFTSFTVRGVSVATVILDFTGVSFDAIYGGSAANVTLANMTIICSGAAPGSGWIRDHASSVYAGWTFENIRIGACGTTAKVPFLFAGAATVPGAGITFKNIATTSAFNATSLFQITGGTVDLNMHITGIDLRLHTSAMLKAIHLTDVRDVRIDNCTVYGCATIPIQVQSSNVALGVYDVDIVNCVVDGQGLPTAPGIHVGNQTVSRVTKGVRVHGNTVRNINSYGIELEGGTRDSEIIGNTITGVISNGIPIPDDTRNIIVAYNTIDGVSGSFCAGIAVVYGRGHRIINNIIRNVVGTAGNGTAIRHDENGDIALENEWNVISGNVIYNVDSVYHVTAASMPQTVVANKFGSNRYSNATIYSTVDAVTKTQAEFAALFPVSIAAADVAGIPTFGWAVGAPARATGGLIAMSLGD